VNQKCRAEPIRNQQALPVIRSQSITNRIREGENLTR
jgi:hypothetical protein